MRFWWWRAGGRDGSSLRTLRPQRHRYVVVHTNTHAHEHALHPCDGLVVTNVFSIMMIFTKIARSCLYVSTRHTYISYDVTHSSSCSGLCLTLTCFCYLMSNTYNQGGLSTVCCSQIWMPRICFSVYSCLFGTSLL
jgi:hypothetical protein